MTTNVVPQKIVLKSTTKMSLNERFSTIQQRQPVGPQQVRATMAAQQQASQANRRLAQQMANRPTVQAALRLKKRSLQQRLGVSSNVKSRLQMGPPQRGAMVPGRGRAAPRGYVHGGVYVNTSPRGQATARGRLMTRGARGRGRIAYRGRGTSMRGVRGVRGGIRGSAVRGRGLAAFQSPGQPRGRGRGRGGSGRGSGSRGLMRGRGNQRGRFIRGRGGMRGVRGRGRGIRGGRGRGTQDVSREDLDNQLDAYMSKTKSYLDTELDEYMSQSAANDA